MRQFALNLIVAAVTFIGGIVAASFAPHRQACHADETVATERADATPVAGPALTQGWREIKIGHVSFNIPAQLKPTGPPGGVGVVEALRGDVNGVGLYVCYEYGRLVSSDVNRPVGPSRNVSIGGTRGILSAREYDPLKSLIRTREETSIVTLYFPDLGDGKTKFELYVSSPDLDAAKQVIDTVEIR